MPQYPGTQAPQGYQQAILVRHPSVRELSAADMRRGLDFLELVIHRGITVMEGLQMI